MAEIDPEDRLKAMETEIEALKKSKDAFEEENIKLKKKDAKEDKYMQMQENFGSLPMPFHSFVSLSQSLYWILVRRTKIRIHMMNLWKKVKTETGKPQMETLCVMLSIWSLLKA